MNNPDLVLAALNYGPARQQYRQASTHTLNGQVEPVVVKQYNDAIRCLLDAAIAVEKESITVYYATVYTSKEAARWGGGDGELASKLFLTEAVATEWANKYARNFCAEYEVSGLEIVVEPVKIGNTAEVTP